MNNKGINKIIQVKNLAAIKIQSIYRGYKVRKVLKRAIHQLKEINSNIVSQVNKLKPGYLTEFHFQSNNLSFSWFTLFIYLSFLFYIYFYIF